MCHVKFYLNGILNLYDTYKHFNILLTRENIWKFCQQINKIASKGIQVSPLPSPLNSEYG